MRIFSLKQIQPVLDDKVAVLEAVKQGFIFHAQGKITLPEPVQLLFGDITDRVTGDCHIKTASSQALPFFCIKVATGFYDNPAQGLPVNNGLVVLMSSETGAPLALFQDDGYLTSIRTAAAGALAAKLVKSDRPLTLGIIGTGHQAELQARWISQTRPISKIVLWGRSEDKAKILKERLKTIKAEITISPSVTDLCGQAELIVTTTYSNSPLVQAKDIKPGHHIIAMGSDSPGKTELEPGVLKRADVILTDDHAQCLHHGEFGHAVKSGMVRETDDVSFGAALNNPGIINLAEESISIVDLTGLGAQDLAIASMVYESLI